MSRAGRGRVRALAVMAALLLLSVACSSSSSQPLVAVIGDSITFLASSDIQVGLSTDGDRTLMTGRIGFTAAQLGATWPSSPATTPGWSCSRWAPMM
jgi:hypothetical protein